VKEFPYEFKLKLCILICFNSVLTYGFEKFVVWYIIEWWKKRND